MSLQVRLTLVYSLALATVLLGIGITLYLYLAHDLQADFEEDLSRLAGAYAQLAIGPEGVTLRALPPAPIREEIEDPEVFLLDTQGQVLQAISASGELPQIPSAQLEQARFGGIASFAVDSPASHTLWQVALSPFPVAHEKRAVLFPIVTVETAFRTAYIVMLQATDLGAVRILNRIRDSLLLWLVLGSGLALGVGYGLARYVTQPLHDIALTARRVEAGQLGSRIPRDKGRDEISLLKQRLNTMLERLENLVDAQRRFTADAAHDLRTPLTVLKGDLEVTLRRPRSINEYRETLERMRTEVNRLTRLAEDLLTLSRLEAGLSNPFSSFALTEALETILPPHAKAAAQKGLEWFSKIPPNLQLYGDAGMIARAVGNLLSNAIAHTEQGQVGFGAQRNEDRVWLQVWDSGPGIPPDQRELIFERFHKGERSKGAGLGLSIVAQVARLHQGKIHIQDRPGGGTLFILDLPGEAYG
ncbi:HAMP domain-containing sensor histidine kinase [uncultured Meiothermus sp.]|jgi:signal transduction histidine kinase|uniref:sensor histidine kinase n=1 Tax=uncultured Meiothermus sp. TaxID=157471 RepID=UPI00262C2D26|nr:HAMP domain-containing sensor histidine kinase [uncultured Meiothermus sp.]